MLPHASSASPDLRKRSASFGKPGERVSRGQQKARTADKTPDDANPELKVKPNINRKNTRRLSQESRIEGSTESCSRPSYSLKILSHPPQGSEHLQRRRKADYGSYSSLNASTPDWPEASGSGGCSGSAPGFSGASRGPCCSAHAKWHG